MKRILETRLIHWKKQWFSILFWLLLPVVATVAIAMASNAIQEDSKVPVGIVLEEQTDASMELYKEIKGTPFIRVEQLHENEALYKLKKHELDSVFIVHDGFEEEIQNGSRNQIITSYQSDLSFAYTPVKEMIISYVQQETGRSKAAFTVQELTERFHSSNQWGWEEIVAKSKEIQKAENLLETDFSFAGAPLKANEDPQLLNVWGLWAILSILSTLLIFDWVINEKQASVMTRFPFMRYSLKNYMICNFFIYSVLLLVGDLLTIFIVNIVLEESIDFLRVISFRIMINIVAFLLANQFKHLFLFYTLSFACTLFITISSGAILPISGITARWPWLEALNPIQPFLSEEIVNPWLFFAILLFIIWYVRKEKINA